MPPERASEDRPFPREDSGTLAKVREGQLEGLLEEPDDLVDRRGDGLSLGLGTSRSFSDDFDSARAASANDADPR